MSDFETKRLPVVYQGQQLMPMKESKIRRLIEDGKAKLVKDNNLDSYIVELLFEPSGFKTQNVGYNHSSLGALNGME